MTNNRIINGLVLIIVAVALASCQPETTANESALTSNSPASLEKPYLLLVSLDGFRWDYVEKYNPPNLSSFIKTGVKAEALIPSFPSKTFPNHYTIATGMYPDNHGLLGNIFYSYEKNLTYSIGNREMVEDGTFYRGSPIWVQADKAEMVTASYFFVGSEADIQGIRPTYYHTYDGSIKNEVRVAQVLDWLALPERERPHLITLYFSDMDDTGHRYGPNNDEEIKKALFDLDENLAALFKGTEASGLPVNIIIVSDHGMAAIPTTNLIPIEGIKNDSLFFLIDNGALVNIHPQDESQTDSIFQFLKEKENHFSVYKTENTPGFEYVPKDRNWGAIQVIPDIGYYFSTSQRIAAIPNPIIGVHGYDPEYKDMHGIFYANGPAFKTGYEVASVKNIHIYPIMCKILGLEIPDDIDGKLDELENVLVGTE